MLVVTLPSDSPPVARYAVLGSPIGHSLSPAMQQAAFDHLGLPAAYGRIEVDEAGLEEKVATLRRENFAGWNCTVPNKLRMFELCDRRSESAEQFRAVNTVVNENGRLVGHNTDGLGWSRALRQAFARGPGDLRILLLGAGGAAQAIATQALLEKCPRLLIANRNFPRARLLIDHLQSRFPSAVLRAVDWNAGLPAALVESDLVVNATSAGLNEADPILLARWLRPELMIFDTIYGSGTLALKKEVSQTGGHWTDGLGMLLHQGAAAFTLWTGREAPLEIMREALQKAFSASRD